MSRTSRNLSSGQTVPRTSSNPRKNAGARGYGNSMLVPGQKKSASENDMQLERHYQRLSSADIDVVADAVADLILNYFEDGCGTNTSLKSEGGEGPRRDRRTGAI
jgi:hypothetical protein